MGGIDTPTRCDDGRRRTLPGVRRHPRLHARAAGDAPHGPRHHARPRRREHRQSGRRAERDRVHPAHERRRPICPAIAERHSRRRSTSCDRCEDQDLGPVLAGAVTDATGAFTIEEYIPVGVEFAAGGEGRTFRRATTLTLPAEARVPDDRRCRPRCPTIRRACPATMTDGLAVNIPRIAVTTGAIDAMECVLEKMGIAHTEFANPEAPRGASTCTVAGTERRERRPARRSHRRQDAARRRPLRRPPDDPLATTSSSPTARAEHWDDDFTERDASGDERARVREPRRPHVREPPVASAGSTRTARRPTMPPTALATGLGPAGTWADLRHQHVRRAAPASSRSADRTRARASRTSPTGW